MIFTGDIQTIRNNVVISFNTLYFIHIPKTSGSSIVGRKIAKLNHVFGIKDARKMTNLEGGFSGDNFPYFKKAEFPEKSNLKFTIIRNPYDLLCSYYFHGDELASDGTYKHSGWAACNYAHNFKTFKEFINCYCDPDFAWHVPLFKNFLYSQLFDGSGNCLVDFIIKYEQFNEASKILEQGDISLSRRISCNISKRKKEKYYSYYDEEMIQKVKVKCARELDLFRYNFNNSLDNNPIIIPKNHICYFPYEDRLEILQESITQNRLRSSTAAAAQAASAKAAANTHNGHQEHLRPAVLLAVPLLTNLCQQAAAQKAALALNIEEQSLPQSNPPSSAAPEQQQSAQSASPGDTPLNGVHIYRTGIPHKRGPRIA